MRFYLLTCSIVPFAVLCCLFSLSGCGAGGASQTEGAAKLIEIAIAPANQTISQGAILQLGATGTYSDKTTQNLTASVVWQTSPSTVATITTNGKVTGVGQGVAQVSAVYQGVMGSTAVTVGQPALLSITVSPNASSLPVGESEQLTATGNFSDGTTQNLTQSATWGSSAPAVAHVNAQGVATGMAVGVAQVSAAYQGITGSGSLTIGQAALLSITVSSNSSSLPVGESEQFTATGNFTDGTTQNLTQSATWTSSEPTVASVSSSGWVATNAVGTDMISATAGSVVGSASLTVTSAVVVALNIVPTTSTMVLESNDQFQAIGTYSNGTTQNMTGNVAWSSTQPNIASVSTGGLVIANQVGSTTILAETSDLTASASLTVTPLLLVNYFNLANSQNSGIDGTIRLSNPGVTSGGICAMIYVFDSKQDLNECCGCFVSDSGLLTLSLIHDLTSNPLTGIQPTAGAIEIVASDVGQNGQCNAGSLTPNGVLVGWATSVQGSQGSYQVTEATSGQAPLSTSEAIVLPTECSVVQQLGSGQGICTCGSGN